MRAVLLGERCLYSAQRTFGRTNVTITKERKIIISFVGNRKGSHTVHASLEQRQTPQGLLEGYIRFFLCD